MPSFARTTVHTDTLESVAWGLQWQWGYDKHPQLAAWISGLAIALGGSMRWTLYLVGALNIILCFWAVWQLAQRLLTPAQALVSVCLLETIWYYNLLGPKFDPNTLMISLWALTTLATYLALDQQTRRWWLLAGLLAGCTIIAKYQSAVFLLSLLLSTILTERGRAAWKGAGPYLSLLAFVAVIAPNVYWLSQHDFISWGYAMSRVGSHHGPWHFLTQQLGTLALFGVAVLIVSRYSKGQKLSETWQERYCLIVGLGPLVLTIGISAIMGFYLYAKWAAPYFFLWGLLAMLLLKPAINAKQARAWTFTAIMLTMSVALARGLYLTYFPVLARDHFVDAFYPYAAIAQQAERYWRAETTEPLQIVGGNHYLAAGLSVYLPEHPAPFMDWDLKQSDWIHEADLRREGAIFAWDLTQGIYPPADWPVKFLGVHTFPSTNPRQKLQFTIAFAVLPPQNDAHL